MNRNEDVINELKAIDRSIIELAKKRNTLSKETTVHTGAYLSELNVDGSLNQKHLKQALTHLSKLYDKENPFLYERIKDETTVVKIGNHKIGNGHKLNVFGPCAVESYEQTLTVAQHLFKKNISVMRGGAFKPRTSPYDFQGLGQEGIDILSQVRNEIGINVVSEIVSVNDIEYAAKHLDAIQVGARNMQNFELLKALGKVDVPIILKRGLSATIDEWLKASEYILSGGNKNVILCERGIRTYETATRNTLDISAVPILKSVTHLPVIVDVTHSTGRKDIMLQCAKAAVAVGADGVMAEVHPNPIHALSDQKQQMSLEEFDLFYENL